jgi:hypothetical protein
MNPDLTDAYARLAYRVVVANQEPEEETEDEAA